MIDHLWFVPGSVRVDWGFVTPHGDALHRSTTCGDAFVETLRQVDVFEHPDLGRYIINPRTGERRIAPAPCVKDCAIPKACTEADCGKDAYAKGLCRSHYTYAWRAKNPARAIKQREAEIRWNAKRRAAYVSRRQSGPPSVSLEEQVA